MGVSHVFYIEQMVPNRATRRKYAVLPQVFFCHILKTVPKNLIPFKVVPVHFDKWLCTIQIHAYFNRYKKWKMLIFDLIAHGNAVNTANDCQIMNFSHVEKRPK